MKNIRLMGVLNINDDSFFMGSRFHGDAAIKHIRQMIADGADMIDVGGVSSRPGSAVVSEVEEMRRVKPVIDAIFEAKLYEEAMFSLDSYSPECLEYALSRGFRIVNDITGLKNDAVAEVAARYGAIVCIMHMQKNPQTMQQEPFYVDVVQEVEDFFKERLAKAKAFGINEVILDVGIGFGKTLAHNIALIQAHSRFARLGCDLLIGASRKTMIDHIISTPIDERLPGTLILHVEAVRQGANIVRCHDVKAHVQALAVYRALQKGENV